MFYSSAFCTSPGFIPSSTGLEMTSPDYNLENRLSWIFSTENIKTMFGDSPIRLVIPVAVSNELQKLDKLSVSSGISADKFAVDYYGNVYLVCRSVSAGKLPDTVTVEMTVSTNLSFLYAPKDYYYPVNISSGLLSAVFSGTDTGTQAEINEILKIIDNFRDSKNGDSENELTQIYNAESSFNYLNDNSTFLKHAAELSVELRKAGCGARISTGFYMPEVLDTLFPGYMLEVFIPGRAVLLLDRKLEIFNNSANFIKLISGNTSFKPVPFIGVFAGNEFYRPEGTLYLESSVLNSEKNKNERRKNIIYLKYNSGQKSVFDASLYFAGFADSYYSLFPLYAADKNQKIFYNKAFADLVENVSLSLTPDESGNPADESPVYSAGDKIYSTVYFKDSAYEKKLTMTWKDPSGEVFYSKDNEVNRSWRSYYRIFTVNERTRKGTWILEIYLNGNLEARREFTVK